MKNIITMFKSSSKEMNQTKTLAIGAMLVALSMILGLYSIYITSAIRISFAYLPVAIAGLLYGPIVGATLGGTVDLLNFVVKPGGSFSPGFTLSAILTGLLFGLLLYHKPISLKRITISNFSVGILCNWFLNSIWLPAMYGVPLWTNLLTRGPVQIIMAIINTVLLYALVQVLKHTSL